ncbi:MAG: LuxR C-terminal-related transcriptional regulator [Terrimesophilobacter sp.]
MRLLDTVLEHFTAPSPSPSSAASEGLTDDAFLLSLRALEHFVAGEYELMTDPVASALRLVATDGSDPDALALTRAVAAFTVAGWPNAATDPELFDPITGGDPLDAAAADESELSVESRTPVTHLLAEAALACARIRLAAQFLDRAGPLPATLFGRAHPYLTVMRVLHIRVRAFEGEITLARDLVAATLDRANSPVELMFARAVACLVDGSFDSRSTAKDLADLIESSGVEPASAVVRGCYLLAAYGLAALGREERAAAFILAAGADPGLARFMIIDRVLGLELLASAAIGASDVDSAEVWLAQALPLREHPIAASTVARIESRVALLNGDADRAVERAEFAIEYARGHGRLMEASDGEIVLARARIAASQRGEAAQRLQTVVSEATGHGYHSVRRSAARELRGVGRRLLPAALSGLDGLSPREVEVAEKMAAGLSNSQIARELYLSEHTVRVHVSRVLCAFGVATRIGVAKELYGATAAGIPAPALTPRQRDIVNLIVTEASNADIAQALGIGVKTVESHVSEILRRWGARSRAGIARIALGETRDNGQRSAQWR